MKPETRICTDDGWRIKKYPDGRTHADARKAWKAMCDPCQEFIKAHLGLVANSGSKEPPELGENSRLQKKKGNKRKTTIYDRI